MNVALPTNELIERYLVGGSPSADVDDLQHALDRQHRSGRCIRGSGMV